MHFCPENFFFLIPLPFVDKVIENSCRKKEKLETEFIDLWAESGKTAKTNIVFSSTAKGSGKFGFVNSFEILGFGI